MKKRFLYLILPIITLILEILPYGAVCNFANADGESLRKTYSYFNLIPFGYANVAPLITAVITCIVFVLVAFYCIKGNARTVLGAKILLLIAVVTSLCPLLFGIRYFSLVGGLITLSLAAELLLIQLSIKKT